MRSRAPVPSVIVSVTVGQSRCSTADPNRTQVGDNILLLTQDTTGDAASLGGVLGTDAAGCITIGPTVIIAPPGSILFKDGTVRLTGKTLHAGATVTARGGAAPIPAHSPCRADHYFYVSPDYPAVVLTPPPTI